jgi:hypothetical protein
MNESYQEAAIIESKYKGEGTADYYRSMQMQVPSTGQQAVQNLKNRLAGSRGQPLGGSFKQSAG